MSGRRNASMLLFVLAALGCGVLINGMLPQQRAESAPQVADPPQSRDATSALGASASAEPQQAANGPESVAASPQNFVPRDPETFHVVVVDDRAQPMSGVQLMMGLAGDRMLRGPGYADKETACPVSRVSMAVLVTDETGRCDVTLPSHRVVLQARKPGVAASREVGFDELCAARNADGVTVIPLYPHVTIEGEVLAADGAPAGVCDVSARAELRTGQEVSWADARTAADGRFRFELEGARSFSLAATNGEVWDHVRIEPASDASVHTTLHLPGDWWVIGVVRDERGSPVPGLAVVCLRIRGQSTSWLDWFESDSRDYEAPATGETDEEGMFRVRVSALDRYLVLALGRDCPVSDPALAVVDTENPRANVNLKLIIPATVRGHLVSDDGLPIPDHRMFIAAADPPLLAAYDTSREDSPAGATMTDKDGAFEFGRLHPRGSYNVSPIPFRGEDGRVRYDVGARSVAAGTMNLVLTPTRAMPTRPGSIVLRVRATTGQPIETLRWSLVRRSEVGAKALLHEVSAPTGECLIDDLLPGTEVTLAVAAEGFAAVAVPVVPSREGTLLSVDLPVPGSLDVGVIDTFGASIPFVQVSLRRDFEAAGLRVPRPAFTDSEGRARFTLLDPGHYTASVTLGGIETTANVDLRGGEAASVSMQVVR